MEFILLIIAFIVVTILIGKSGKAVIFFDTQDLLIALAMWLVWLLYFIYWFLVAYPSDLVLLITAGISLVLGIKTVQLSVKYNKSILIGIPIGLLKIFCAILGAVLIVGVLDDLIFPSRNQTICRLPRRKAFPNIYCFFWRSGTAREKSAIIVRGFHYYQMFSVPETSAGACIGREYWINKRMKLN